MKPKNTPHVMSVTTPAQRPAADLTEALEAARAEAREARAEAAATRSWADATTAQLRAMQALTDTALSHLALDDLLRELLGRVTAVMGVDAVGIFLLDADGHTMSLRAARGLGEGDVGLVQIAVGRGIPGRIMASRAPLIVEADTLSAADFEGADPILWERLRSLAGVPLLVDCSAHGLAEGQGSEVRLIGVLSVGSTVPHRFTDADVQLLQHAADRIARSIDRAHLYAAEQDARQQAEAALARAVASEMRVVERAEHLNTILETMADGVAVYDAEGHLTQMNRAFRDLHALERAPAGYESLPNREWVRLIAMRHATGAPLAVEELPIGRALRGEVVTGSSSDLRVRAFDGRELEVNVSAAPLRDSDGHVAGAVLVVRDVTWRNQLEREREAAREQAERQADQLDHIFEAAADGLVVWDAEGRLVRMNPATRHILGLDAAPPDFILLPVRERLATYAARDQLGRTLALEEWPNMRVLRGGVMTGPEARDLRLRALDGREVELNLASAPLRDREGHLMGVVSVVHDQTERNRLERERAAAHANELAAREASRRLEAFLAVAAHDLRSPLTAVIGYLALAQRQAKRLAAAAAQTRADLAPMLEDVHDRVEDATLSAKRLTRLLTVLFDMAAIRADRLELRRAPSDLVALVREQVAELRVSAPERTIRLQLPAGDAPIPVEVDADRLGQVITNYVTNAVKYSPADQPVEVGVAVRGRRARVTVCDRGPGLPKEELARVWELFHRVPGITAKYGTQSGSLGLGLHISKAIVTAHGGRVGVKSTVGQGSTFWFTLPLAAVRSIPAGEAA